MIGLNILARSSMRLSIRQSNCQSRIVWRYGLRGSIGHARTEVDEGLAPSVHRQSRPESVAEKVELLVRVTPPSQVVLAVHDLCLAWMQRQSTVSKPLRKFRLQLLSLTLAAVMTNSIIGKAFKRNLRMVFGHPPIEHIVQKEVCQQG